MKKPLFLLLVPLVLGGVVLAIVCAGVLLTMAHRFWPTPPVGVVLIYEVDPQHQDPGRPVDMDRLVGAINYRVNPGGWNRSGQVRLLDDRRIEIGVFGNDPAKVRRIERILGSIGTLEFRILANDRDHKLLIQRAQRENADVLKDAEGNVEAWWVPVRASQEKSFEDYLYRRDRDGRRVRIPELQTEVAIRETVREGQRTLELLVVKDVLDVTGAYLTEVRRDWDEVGNARVDFTLDSRGARLFGRLTSLNLPVGEVQPFYRKLAIILDGRLYSAPRINSTIYERGVIEGSFTEEEVDDLVSVLNAGALPVAIRQVEKRRVGAQQ